MPAGSARVPKYCHFRPRGLAYVRIRGRVRYLGKYGSPEGKEEYRRALAELDANPAAPPPSEGRELTVLELCAAYLDFAEGYYVKDGRPTDQMGNVRRAIRVVKELYGHARAVDFGPLALRAVQEHMVKNPCVHPLNKRVIPYSRTTINGTCALHQAHVQVGHVP